MFSKTKIETSMKDIYAKIQEADAIVIGAGAGLSTAAGYEYAGERFNKYFSDFEEKYGIHDMYSGGFYPYDTLEEYWAWWSRQVYYNRYVDHLDLYQKLFQLVKDKDYFVLTTNVDHCFQKANFDKQRVFYTQGDYGLWQRGKRPGYDPVCRCGRGGGGQPGEPAGCGRYGDGGVRPGRRGPDPGAVDAGRQNVRKVHGKRSKDQCDENA